MADITSSTILSENTREIVMAFQYQYVDTGNESEVTKVDVSTLQNNADGNPCTGVKITKCIWVVKGMTVQVLAGASTNIIMLNLDEGQSGEVDYTDVGGLPNTKTTGSSPTGDIKFTTTGAGSGDSYQIVLTMLKKY
tara:strand:- start:731 stop:1141 length:411 start_codon:yes stop_codon:yes gene_type:complete